MTLQNAFENLAVESKQDAAIAELQTIAAGIADLDVNTDGLEAALASLVTALQDVDLNTDTLESLTQDVVDALADVNTALGGTLNVNITGGSVSVTGGLTDAQLRAAPVPISDGGGSLTVDGSVAVSNFPATQPVSGPLTDAQLRATAVPVSGPLTDAQLRATAVPVSGPLTDAQLRATNVPISSTQLNTLAGTVKNEDSAASNADPGTAVLGVRNDAAAVKTSADGDYSMLSTDSAGRVGITALGGTIPVSGPLTDAQLRASAVPVSVSNFPATQAVSGPLTDAQLRASAVPVSGPLTDAQLRATRVPVIDTDGNNRLDALISATAAPAFQAHGQTAVGTTAVVVNSSGTAPAQGVLVKASVNNTANVYVGRDSGVTTANGFELAPGEANLLPRIPTNNIWLIGGAASQSVSWEMF